ncbi:MAG: hypothetical protein QM504_11995 [Pseudomonadota bacterium]
MKKLLLTSILILQSSVIYADRGTEQFVSLLLNQLTVSNEAKGSLVEYVKYISPKFLTDAKIKPNQAELDIVQFDHFKILGSSGPYVSYETDRNGCTGCKYTFRVKIEKHNNEYVLIPSGYNKLDKYYIKWWWPKSD